MKSDLKAVTESKRAFRKQLARKPPGEKLRIVEQLAERSLATRKDTSASLPEEPWPIPGTWRWARMGDVSTIVGGSTPRTDRAEYFGGEIPWITPADLSGYKEKTISRGARNITQAGLENSGARLMPAETILFSSRAPIGYVAIAANPVATNQGFKSFVLNDALLPDFVYYYLQRAKEFALALASGTTFLEISGKNAARLPIPVPPLDEQRQIVAEIEKQFTRLEAGGLALRRVQANLKRYRAAVLKAACEGKLVPTEAQLSRSQRSTKNSELAYEPGAQLLKRILAEGRQRWTGRGKYKEPAAPDTAKLPPVPEGWTWASSSQVLREVKDGTHDTPAYHSTGIPFITQKHIKPAGLVFADYKFISAEDHEHFYKRSNPQRGDILVSMIGVNRGESCIVNTDEIFSIKNVGLFKPNLSFSSGKFIQHYMSSRLGQQLILKQSKGGAQPFIGLTELRAWPIPLPPLAEQTRIAAEVERRLSVVEELESVLSFNLRRATRLRQSILQQAFSDS